MSLLEIQKKIGSVLLFMSYFALKFAIQNRYQYRTLGTWI